MVGARSRLWRGLVGRGGGVLLALGIGAGAAVGACDRAARVTTQEAPSQTPAAEVPATPSLRLYVASTLAGAMEPCGCRKDMLGGVDHAAELLKQGAQEAPHSVVVAAGPLFFMDPEVNAENGVKDQQDRWKADAIASAVSKWDLVAWAPGVNDFGRGAQVLASLTKASGATPLGANLRVPGVSIKPVQVVERGGVRVGLAAVSMLGLSAPLNVPSEKAGTPQAQLTVAQSDAIEALRGALKQLKNDGVAVKVVLLAAPRGDALRIIEAVPGFNIAVVGKAKDAGESNDAPVPPALLGNTLIVQGPNHLQAMPVVDLFIRDANQGASGLAFEDASGIKLEERRLSLQGRIAELSKRLGDWKASKKVRAEDLAAREKDLAAMQQELGSLPTATVPPKGNFFRYKLEDVREGLGSEPDVQARMRSYYKKVNEYNKEAFKDRKPLPAPQGSPTFVGGAECESCHEEATVFWKTTGHAKAYKTLTDDFKEFNLDCVGCHVTGYDMPGGSTVTFVEGLKDVQCETCHGPGSIHVKDEDTDAIELTPPQALCSKCHHPPHVADDWDVNEAWTHIVGPGHGQPSVTDAGSPVQGAGQPAVPAAP